MLKRCLYPLVMLLGVTLMTPGSWAADDSDSEDEKSTVEEKDSKAKEPKLPSLEDYASGATSIPGLIPLHQKKDELYAELTGSQLNTDYIIVVSIAKGIGELPLLGGWSWDMDEYGDLVWQFRKVDDRIQVVRRNYRYQADSGTPEEKALAIAYTDSIIYSLPIVAKGPKGGDVVNIGNIFMSDLPMISSKALQGFSFARERSTWAKVKGLKDNVELQVAATYSGGGKLETVMDSRGVSLNIHYSISKLPGSGYQPRLADERVGYFNTVVKNFSKNQEEDNFVRYINRWKLQKLESSSDISLPKKPIVFWLEKTIPYQYRKTIRDGILEWNKAFERAGFYNAIEVRQQEDNDTWDPEDINYNTIRWSTANAGLSIGPTRVNPLTGEILDADILLDVGFITHWNRTFELYNPGDLTQQFIGGGDFERIMQINESDTPYDEPRLPVNESLFYSQQMGLATTFFETMAAGDLCQADDESADADDKKNEDEANSDSQEKDNDGTPDADESSESKDDAAASDDSSDKDDVDKGEESKPKDESDEDAKSEDQKDSEDSETDKKEDKESKKDHDSEKSKEAKLAKEYYERELKKVVQQGISSTVTHEVGHTLGLRHNFKLSTLHSLDEINNFSEDSEYGYVGSIMEYQPVNISLKGTKQGPYYSTKLGEYDYWVIEYGYKDFGKGTDSERSELQKLAARQTETQFNYATDEDLYYTGSDPMVNIFDLGNSPLAYGKLRASQVKQILPGLDERIIKDGDSYNKLMTRFNMLLSWHGTGVAFALPYIGGLYVNRDFKGDPDARPPFTVVAAADQREAFKFLCDEIFSPTAYQFPPELFNYLAPNRWRHWGSEIPNRYDLDIHGLVLEWQTDFLSALFSQRRISRMVDAAYRVEPDQDVFTVEEMVQSLTDTIFQELDQMGEGPFTPRKPAIASLRRNLQRVWFERLAAIALDQTGGSSLTISGGTISISGPAATRLNALARDVLSRLAEKINAKLNDSVEYDPATRAHLRELANRIERILNANVVRES
ncbi:MAG: zinc-dependent metalloprotease [Planctomycetia bacterium]|nr:zinc-dependent metalloprotease [Planctomycetia bacterium]